MVAATRTYRCPDDHPHALTCYSNHRCGCGRCRAANAVAAKRRRRSVADGLAVAPVRAAFAVHRVRALREAGWTREEISVSAGIGKSTVDRLIRDAQPRVAREVAVKLAQPLRRPRKPPRGTVDATGVRRRLQALTAHGWMPAELARQMGHSPANVRRLYRKVMCERQTRDAVLEMYARLWLVPAPARHRDAARALAARNGWVSALAWNNIDDPNEQPSRETAHQHSQQEQAA